MERVERETLEQVPGARYRRYLKIRRTARVMTVHERCKQRRIWQCTGNPGGNAVSAVTCHNSFRTFHFLILPSRPDQIQAQANSKSYRALNIMGKKYLNTPPMIQMMSIR